MLPQIPRIRQATSMLVGVAFSAVLVACGGGQGSSGSAEPATRSAETVALQQEGARLNSEELAQIAKTGVLPKAFEGKLISGATTKVAATRIPVYRFFNTLTSGHFYTSSETEKANVLATLPHMHLDGVAFHATMTAVPGLSPVHRFYNTQTGVHFYTITESERAHVAATLPHYTYDGIAYYASTLPGTGYTPLYRFFYAARGYHFYTNSAAEKDSIIATLPQYSYEGIGYYVLGDDWRAPAVPHTGVTAMQCVLDVSGYPLGNCSDPAALRLSPKQDGHRTAVNPMNYSQLPSLFGPYPKTSCVRDNVTGLVWEGKTASGQRAGGNTYNHYTEAVAYVAAVNALELCGYTDWRLPSAQELQGIVDYGTELGPLINVSWFPNTAAVGHWSQTVEAGDTGRAWQVSFFDGSVGATPRVSVRAVRLVRGAQPTGPRYLVTTRSYSGDAANNAVVDRYSGLVWRRCLNSQAWTGTTCTAITRVYSQPDSLRESGNIVGWRLPNVKELGTLTDLARSLPAMDLAVFPGVTNSFYLWASTPEVISDKRFLVGLGRGDILPGGGSGGGSAFVHLVADFD